MSPPEEANMATIAYRLDQIDKRLDRLDGNLDRLAFVPLELYKSERASMTDRVDSAVKLAMWSLGLVCSLTVAALIGLLVRLATA